MQNEYTNAKDGIDLQDISRKDDKSDGARRFQQSDEAGRTNTNVNNSERRDGDTVQVATNISRFDQTSIFERPLVEQVERTADGTNQTNVHGGEYSGGGQQQRDDEERIDNNGDSTDQGDRLVFRTEAASREIDKLSQETARQLNHNYFSSVENVVSSKKDKLNKNIEALETLKSKSFSLLLYFL